MRGVVDTWRLTPVDSCSRTGEVSGHLGFTDEIGSPRIEAIELHRGEARSDLDQDLVKLVASLVMRQPRCHRASRGESTRGAARSDPG